MDKGITRRNFLKTAGVGVLALGITGTSATVLSGCGVSFDFENKYLPLGSVVKLKEHANTELKVMVVSRRPRMTSALNGDDEKVNLADQGIVVDYAGVFWPVGIITDLSSQHIAGDMIEFNRDSIERVEFVGYSDDQEQIAATTLDTALGSTLCSDELLIEQFLTTAGTDINAAISEEASEE